LLELSCRLILEKAVEREGREAQRDRYP
jgi:hypothetical protein